MPPPTPSPFDDLYELASLDALAMLDEHDAALFERAFFAAPASVQRDIRELQAAITADPMLGSSESPPADLGDRTVRRVVEEIRRSEAELAPLAFIGRGEVGDRLAPGLRARRRLVAGFGSMPLWRAASLVLAAGLVTTLVFLYKVVETNHEMVAGTDASATSKSIRDRLGLQGWATWSNAPRYATLVPATASFDSAVATVAVNDRIGAVAVVALGLATDGEPYTFRVISSTGTVAFEKALAFDGRVGAATFEVASRDIPLLQNATFEIVDGRNEVALRQRMA